MWQTFRSFFAPPISAHPTQVTAQLAWLVRLRWIALAAQLLSIVPAIAFEVLEPRLLPVFLGVIALLVVFNCLTWLSLKRASTTSQRHILIQLVVDIAALSTLLAITGGAWNPLVPILFVHSVLGAMLLEGQRGLLFFGLMIICLGLIQANSHIPPRLEDSLLPAVILFPAQFLIALVFWILTAWLSRTLSALQSHVQDSRVRKTRIDRLRAVGALAAGLSHEFATPLNTAQLRIDRLARAHDLENDANLVTAREELERCGEILRHMAGAQLKPERLSFEVVDVDLLAKQICSSIANVHEGVTLRLAVDGRSPRRALIPSVAFSQALLNLIENAIESGGRGSAVEVAVGSDGHRVELTVSDRGAGWPTIVRNHLGEPFVTTKPNGVGLGLYYVHSLAEAIGAELTLEDREEGGAVARISLPAAGRGDPATTEAEA